MQQEWNHQFKFGISFSFQEGTAFAEIPPKHQVWKASQGKEFTSHSVGDSLFWEILTLWALGLLLPKDSDLL